MLLHFQLWVDGEWETDRSKESFFFSYLFNLDDKAARSCCSLCPEVAGWVCWLYSLLMFGTCFCCCSRIFDNLVMFWSILLLLNRLLCCFVCCCVPIHFWAELNSASSHDNIYSIMQCCYELEALGMKRHMQNVLLDKYYLLQYILYRNILQTHIEWGLSCRQQLLILIPKDYPVLCSVITG